MRYHNLTVIYLIKPTAMKRKSDQPHSRYEESSDDFHKDQDCGDIIARLGKELIEEYLGPGHLGRQSDVSLNRFTETALLELACMEHRKRMKSVSSVDLKQYEEIRDSHGSHATKNGPVKHSHHRNYSTEQSYGLATSAHELVQSPARLSTESPGSEHSYAENQHIAQRRMSSSTGSLPSSPSDSEPVTPVRSSPAHPKASKTPSSHEHSTIRECSVEAVVPAQAPLHYRKDSDAHSERIHFNKYNKDHKDPQVIVNDVLEIIKTPAKCSSKRNLYQDGFIYVLHDPNIEGFVKIGRTAKCPTRRKKQIATCSKLQVDFVGSQRLIIGPYHERLEQIIHADLYNERHYFECACSTRKTHDGTDQSNVFTKHSEWFKIDAKEAEQRVEQWRKWMRQEPYKKPGSPGAGELKSDFIRRAQYCYGHPSEIPEERWTKFMAPYYMAERDQASINHLT